MEVYVYSSMYAMAHNFHQRSSGNSISHAPFFYHKLVIRNIYLTANTYLPNSNRYNSKDLVLVSSAGRSYTGGNIYEGLTWHRQEIPSTSEMPRGMFVVLFSVRFSRTLAVEPLPMCVPFVSL